MESKKAQQVIIERLLNTRFTLTGGNVALDPNPNVWVGDILDAYTLYPGGGDDANNGGEYNSGSPATYTVPNAHWRNKRFVGRYLVDSAGNSFAITANTHNVLTVDVPTGSAPAPGAGWAILTKRAAPAQPKSATDKHQEWMFDPGETGRPNFKETNLLDFRSIGMAEGDPDSTKGDALDHEGRRPRRAHVDFIEDALDKSGDGREKLSLLGQHNLMYKVLNARLEYFHKESGLESLFDFSQKVYRLWQDGATDPVPVNQTEWEKINRLVHWYIDTHLGVGGPEKHEFY